MHLHRNQSILKVKIFLLIMWFRTFVYWMTCFICLYIVNNPRLDPININSVSFFMDAV